LKKTHFYKFTTYPTTHITLHAQNTALQSGIVRVLQRCRMLSHNRQRWVALTGGSCEHVCWRELTAATCVIVTTAAGRRRLPHPTATSRQHYPRLTAHRVTAAMRIIAELVLLIRNSYS
jgi:hypothetical protein